MLSQRTLLTSDPMSGLALGAPEKFPDLKIEDIVTMTGTNINGYMFAAYAVLNAGGMKNRKRGTILNVTSVTGLEGMSVLARSISSLG